MVLRDAAVRSGVVLFIVATAQSLAYVLTLQQIPHAIAELLVSLSAAHGPWLFLLLSIAILVIMGSVLEGAAALIVFGPLLMPVARQLRIDPLHYGVVLVIGMGIGLFAPPLGLGLYGSGLAHALKAGRGIQLCRHHQDSLYLPRGHPAWIAAPWGLRPQHCPNDDTLCE